MPTRFWDKLLLYSDLRIFEPTLSPTKAYTKPTLCLHYAYTKVGFWWAKSYLLMGKKWLVAVPKVIFCICSNDWY